LVGCGHVSGLLMRQVWPLALMLCADRVPIVRTGLVAHDPEAGFPNRRLDRFASRHHHPRNSIVLLRCRLTPTLPSPLQAAAASSGAR
jgi:hypothetical protein